MAVSLYGDSVLFADEAEHFYALLIWMLRDNANILRAGNIAIHLLLFAIGVDAVGVWAFLLSLFWGGGPEKKMENSL